MSLESVKQVIKSADLTEEDFNELKTFIDDEMYRLKVSKLKDGEVLISIGHGVLSTAISVDITSYSKDKYNLSAGATFNINKEEGLLWKLDKMEKKIILDIPERNNYVSDFDVVEEDDWEHGDWDDPSYSTGSLCCYITTNMKPTKGMAEGIYLSIYEDDLFAVIKDSDGKYHAYFQNDKAEHPQVIRGISFDPSPCDDALEELEYAKAFKLSDL